MACKSHLIIRFLTVKTFIVAYERIVTHQSWFSQAGQTIEAVAGASLRVRNQKMDFQGLNNDTNNNENISCD